MSDFFPSIRPSALHPSLNSILVSFRHLLAMADSAGMMYALATVLSVLAIVAILLRFYARRIKQTALSWDDYVLLIALVCQLQILRNFRRNVLAEELIIKQLFTIGTAICMFVGK